MAQSAYDLVVIGGGYWGSAIAYEGKQRGWSVLVIDDGDKLAGSRAASGICDPAVFKSKTFLQYKPPDWEDYEITESLVWLVDRGGIVTQEYFQNWFAKTPPRLGAKCIYLPNVTTITNLRGTTITGKVIDLVEEQEGYWVHFETGKPIPTQRLAIAAGYRTDELLGLLGLDPLGVGKLYGRGISAVGVPRTNIPISVMIRPYCKHTVRSWTKGLFKIGDTAEVNKSDKKLDALREVGRTVLEGYEEVAITEGYRPVTERWIVEKLAPGLVVATGGGRVGLGLAGLVSRRTIRALA